MYDKIKEITCDGIEYYYNTGKYLFVFDPPEGGKLWIYRIREDDLEACSNIPFELLEEFVAFANYIKREEKANKTITRDFKETVKDRTLRDPEFRNAILAEIIECILAGDIKTGKALLRNYINTVVENEIKRRRND